MTSVLAEGFGLDTPDVFRQINEKDNFLAHIGGMTLIAEGSNLPGVDKAIDGYLLSKNKNIEDLTLTTNGSQLIHKATMLKESGVKSTFSRSDKNSALNITFIM